MDIIENNLDFRIGSGGEKECHLQHAILRCEPDKNYLTVEDVSENGSLVKARFIHRSKIRIPILFSVLQIGEYLFWFSYPDTIPSGRSHGEFMKQLRDGVAPAGEPSGGEDPCSRRALVRYLRLEKVEPERILERLHSTDVTIEQRSILRCVRERWQRQGELLGGG